MSRVGPPSLRWQVVVLVLASITAAQTVAFGVLLLSPPDEPPRMNVGQVLRALDGPSEAVRAAGLHREHRLEPPFRGDPDPVAALVTRALAEEGAIPPSWVRVRARRTLGSSGDLRAFSVRLLHPSSRGSAATEDRISAGLIGALPLPPFEAAVRRPDGRWTVIAPERRLLTAWRARVAAAFGLSALLLTPVAWWSAQRLTRSVRLFADAAERLGLDPQAPPLPVSGPKEVRIAAASFNRMQDRLRSHAESRTTMLAAIAHDLRTPLTGLRLWAESAPARERDRMAQEIARMNAMITQVLAFVGGDRLEQPNVVTDLAEAAADCAREVAARGVDIQVFAPSPLPVCGQPIDLRRALMNLIENAVTYAEAVEVTAVRRGGAALVTVSDRGPGVPEADLERVLDPFVRLEPSRSRATGGIGLGLASARSVALAHGGALALRNRPGGGLIASLTLPLGQAESAANPATGEGVEHAHPSKPPRGDGRRS